ncbi:MAG: DUF4136 domain-containing protein [Bacteroidia bacterium]
MMVHFRNCLYIYLIPALLFLGGCTGPVAYSERVSDLDYNQFSTYAWLPVTDTSISSVYHNEIVEQNLIEAANQEMESRGYELNTENPDILLLLHLNFEDKEEQVITTQPLYSTYDYYYTGYTPGLWHGTYYYPHYGGISRITSTHIQEIEYTQGQVVIDIIRQSSNELIWRGWSQDVVEPQTANSDLVSMVKQIFEEYPVAKNVNH